MDKKNYYYTFLFTTLFIFSINTTQSTSMDYWGVCGGAVGGADSRVDCWVEGKDWLRQYNSALDEDEDNNISLELRIVNRHDYTLNNVVLNIEKCSKKIKFDSIKSGSIVYVKIDDVCAYEYYNVFKGNFFWSNSSFDYFDEENNLISYNGEFIFPVMKKTEFEIKKAELEAFNKKRSFQKKSLTFGIISILVIFFIALFLIKTKKFKK